MLDRAIRASYLLVITTFYCSSFCNGGQLLPDEIVARKNLADAEHQLAKVEQAMANWRCKKLQELQTRKHATWDELAQQEVVVATAEANLVASQEFLSVIEQLVQALRRSQIKDDHEVAEAITLFASDGPRIVAWVGIDAAGPALRMKYLQFLRSVRNSLTQDSLVDLECRVIEARNAASVGNQSDSRRELNSIQHEISQAKFAVQTAKINLANVIDRRIEKILNLFADLSDPITASEDYFPVGARFVEAAASDELESLVGDAARNKQLHLASAALIEFDLNNINRRLEIQRGLSRKHGGQETHAISQLVAKKRELESEIAKVSTELVEFATTKSSTGDASNNTVSFENASSTLDFANQCVRTRLQILDLEQRVLELKARQVTLSAQEDYLRKRQRKLEDMPVASRRPHELAVAEQQLARLELEKDVVSQQLSQIQHEKLRFTQQLAVQSESNYSLVQHVDGTLLDREQFEERLALVAAGVVGQLELFPKKAALWNYIESRDTSLRDARFSFRSTRNSITSVAQVSTEEAGLQPHLSWHTSGGGSTPYDGQRSMLRRSPYQAEKLERAPAARYARAISDPPKYTRDNRYLHYGPWSVNTHRSRFYYQTVVTFSNPFARPYTPKPHDQLKRGYYWRPDNGGVRW